MSTDIPPGYERAFRVAFEQSTNPMALVDDERRFLTVNPAFALLFGRTQDQLAGTQAEGVMDEQGAKDFVDGWPDFLRTGSKTGEHDIVPASGGTVPVIYHHEAFVLPGQHLGVLQPPSAHAWPSPIVPGEDGPLTPREQEVVGLVAMGLTGEEIADKLVLSPGTVRTHVQNAMGKLGARTRAHLVGLAMRHGWAPWSKDRSER